MPMEISSPAFAYNDFIPTKYSCEGNDIFPQLDIVGIPGEAESLVLVVDDPDAPTAHPWVHRIVWNIAVNGENLSIPEGSVPAGAVQGVNDFKTNKRGGPCPPVGHGVHRYFFKVYALDRTLNLEPSSDKQVLMEAIDDYILEETSLIGKYQRD